MSDQLYITTQNTQKSVQEMVNSVGVITQLAFKKRFPQAKWEAARELSKTNSTLSDFFDDYDKSTYIVLSRAAGKVTQLADSAWPIEIRLTTEEVDFVLSTPIMSVELPDGVRKELGLSVVPSEDEYIGYWGT